MERNSPLQLPALDPSIVTPTTYTNYPPPFRMRVAGRSKQRLGDAAGLKNFGVNLTTIAPGSASSLRHAHSKQDEFVFVLSGELILVTDAGEQRLTPGTAAGFPAGTGQGHCLINRSDTDAVYLEVGDRTPDDSVSYCDDDLAAAFIDGNRRYTRKNGDPY